LYFLVDTNSQKNLRSHEVSEVLELVDEAVQIKVQPGREVIGVCSGQDDDSILAFAKAASAEYIVTGDAVCL
jgi:predicted nucleic acid-binding protein